MLGQFEVWPQFEVPMVGGADDPPGPSSVAEAARERLERRVERFHRVEHAVAARSLVVRLRVG